MSDDTPDIRLAETWDAIYRADDAGWDMGQAAPPFGALLKSPPSWLKPGRLLNVGCGRGHDAYLFAAAGFDVTAVDFADSAIASVTSYATETTGLTPFQCDLFELPSQGLEPFDYLLEHTCFCAIPTARRAEYAAVANAMLAPGGHLFGLFYRFDPPDSDGPPFTLSEDDLRSIFAEHFEAITITTPDFSTEKRQGRERFVSMRRR